MLWKIQDRKVCHQGREYTLTTKYSNIFIINQLWIFMKLLNVQTRFSQAQRSRQSTEFSGWVYVPSSVHPEFRSLTSLKTRGQ